MNRAIVSKEPHMPSQLPEQCADFIRQCLRKDASLRPNAEQLYNHPWVARFTHGQSVFHNSLRPAATMAAPAHGPALLRSPDRCIQDVVRDCAASVRLASEAIHQSAFPQAARANVAHFSAAEKRMANAAGPELEESRSLESTMSVASTAAVGTTAIAAATEPADSSKILAWHMRVDEMPCTSEEQATCASEPGASVHEDCTAACTGMHCMRMAVPASPGAVAAAPKDAAIAGGLSLDPSRHAHTGQ